MRRCRARQKADQEELLKQSREQEARIDELEKRMQQIQEAIERKEKRKDLAHKRHPKSGK